MGDNIKVVVKVRPLIARESEQKLKHQWRVNNNTLIQLDSNGRDTGQAFTFDKVYSENTKTSDVYNDVAKPIVEAAVAGFNGTIFAYGQTSSGKTYTMTGTDLSPGIIPLAVQNLFDKIKNVPGRDFVVSVSYIEIYNETLRDLLDLKKTIKIQENVYNVVKVDATERVTASPDEVVQAMKEGNANRQTGSTNMNESSSRSHSIFQICIESREHIEGEEQAGCVNVSQLNLVDLAGTERAGQTGATGLRFKEGTLINKSLTSLALVIKQLSEDPNKFANYRDSKLTRILQNSIGGNAKTSIICAITPASIEETISTLQFATRAKAIKNKPEVNAVATDATMIQKLTKELSQLQSQLETKKNLEVMLETKKNVEQDLQKQIANLQRFILNGFGQRPNVELMGGARRKLPLPRRITISTLHSIEEDVPKVPKFCTPSLKYNPSLIQKPPDFVPIQNQNKLTSLPEQPPRLVTPPPNERKVYFSGDIIELDSDDDDCPGATTCSPYHKCYDAKKTPPCILRKNAKQAEKNLKDLVELTDIEKMYTPSVVELIEKIEQSNTKTAQLQDEIEALKTIGDKKDLEIEKLRGTIYTTEEDIKSLKSVTSELESQRKELNTKLTDWEVSYETLKNRAKLREQELLCLLDKQRIKQAEDIGKMPLKPKEIFNFMDMSKDISLVNSDNESSIVHPDEDVSSDSTNILVVDMQTQLEAKNQFISELESQISAQKQQIELIEKSSLDLQEQVYRFKEKIGYLEHENSLLQSTVNELNCAIKSQKENLDLAHNDMSSYVSVIQELQIKLVNKETVLNMQISDNDLENMLANEEKTIANNENLKNIVHSFKLALENSKIEIDLLKSRMKNNSESGEKDTIKTKQIEMLNEEIFKLKKQANENMVTINTLLREKGDLAVIEQELILKLSEMEQTKSEHTILSKEQAMQIKILKKDNEKLETTLAEKCDAEKLLINRNETLVKEVHETSNKVTELNEDIGNKNTEIVNLIEQNIELQNCLEKTKLAVGKLQKDFRLLSSDVLEIPDLLDSFVLLYNIVYENLNVLENITVENFTQKEQDHKTNIELKNKIANLVLQHKSQISEFAKATETLNESMEKLTDEIKQLTDKNNERETDIEKLKQELIEKNIELNNLEMQIKAMRDSDTNKRNENSVNEHAIKSFKENETMLIEKIKLLQEETNNYKSIIKMTEDTNQVLINNEVMDKQRLIELENELHQICDELAEAKLKLQHNEESSNQLVEYIIKKLSTIIENIKERNLFVVSSLINETSSGRERIIPILEAVVDHVLKQSLTEIENERLKSEMKQICNNNLILNCDLKQSSELLKKIKEELKIKAAEIDGMQYKTKEWKKLFSDFESSMKQQMLFLQKENEKLKARITNNESAFTKFAEVENNEDIFSPLSLLTICSKHIIGVVNQTQNENMTEATSCLSVENLKKVNTCPDCIQHVLELRILQQENTRLMETVELVEKVNKELLKEQDEMREEVSLLVEPTQELQKKILNHRTNLSILTATTYAENKSLKSQVKGLQHHHSRFHNVCQRDIPQFKKQLTELMAILKDDSSYCDGESFKSYSLPNFLENNLTSSQIRNESTLDGDLLMLDTNVTLTTADNTIVGCNQTCLDFTQTMFNDTGCQTVDQNVTDPNILSNEIDTENMTANLAMLKEENHKLKEQMDQLIKESKENAQIPTDVINAKSQAKELDHLLEQLSTITKEKKEIEKRYNDLVIELTSNDALVHKMKAIEVELKSKEKELCRITKIFYEQSKQSKAVQEEYELLSTQVMEHIIEIDELNKEVEKLRQQNLALVKQASEKDNKLNVKEKSQCDEKTHSEQRDVELHSQPNRSLSDSDTTSRHNKICTLQNELHAGREDCEVLTKDVATIKQHLEQSNMSMDLDQSMNFELAMDSLTSSPQSKKNNMPDIPEERHDLYMTDKNDCYNYYIDKMGVEKKNLASDIKIIEIMKLLHNTLITRHGNEVENLVNKLKDYQETQTNLQTQINDMNVSYSKIKTDLEARDKGLNVITRIVTQLRDNLSLIWPDTTEPLNLETHSKMSGALIEKFFVILDENFNLCSANIFEQITNNTKRLFKEYTSVSNDLTRIKCQLSEKENECNLLKEQNKKIHEINNAVTLDIIKKEKENNNVVRETYQKLLELKMISADKIPLNEPINIHVLIRLLEHFIKEYQKEKAKTELSIEMHDLKKALAEKEKNLNELKTKIEVLHNINEKSTNELTDKDEKIKKLEEFQDELNNALKIKEENNARNINDTKLVIQKLSEEITHLKESLYKKEKTILSLSDKEDKVKELLITVKTLQDDIEKLKTLNETISEERASFASELEKSCATIKQNNNDIDKMTSDILVLRESMKEATAHMEKLKDEEKRQAKENAEIKQELEVKSRECARLEINIKTLEKSTEIQSRMILRLQKLKEEDDKDKNEKLGNLNDKYVVLQKECEVLRSTVKTCNEEIESLKIAKQLLENRLVEEEETGRRSHTSLDATTDSTKRRRQSLHDSKRLFEEQEEHKNLGTFFESKQKVDDLFMEIDDDHSGRSTPFGHGKGRDSLLSKTDHSDKDDEHSSRPSSVLARASRRRRQSSHDLHRSVAMHAPTPTDLSNYAIDELKQFRADTSRNRLQSDNEITQLKAQLASCEQELEDLKERCRELDEECETCSEYLRERDAQYSRLKKEKTALEHLVAELRSPESHNHLTSKSKPSVAHVSVNTDEDWTNLHSVVVDRMSYDAEVEKNKKLIKTIEELRFTKLDLKNTLAKMQKALEKNSGKDNSRELEQTKQKLKESNEELKELRIRYKELDDECETCSNYLKEREEQCRRLKEAKTALETKLQELQEKSQALEHTKSVRKKRQTLHDLNRPETSVVDQTDASTETTIDVSSTQTERDDSTMANESSRDVQYLKKVIERLTQQKEQLENQLRVMHAAPPMYVATGSAIVQNQQITDVMKENQKLKKMNAKLVNICKKRGKSANRENEDPCEQG